MGTTPGRADHREARRVRRGADHRGQFFSIPAFPLETVVDPDGRRRHLRRRLHRLHRSQRGERLTTDVLRRAMAYGTAIASFNVEEFGTDRVARLRMDEVDERVIDLRRMTAFA